MEGVLFLCLALASGGQPLLFSKSWRGEFYEIGNPVAPETKSKSGRGLAFYVLRVNSKTNSNLLGGRRHTLTPSGTLC